MMKPTFAEVLRALALLACTAVLAACGSHGTAPAFPAGGMPLGTGRAAGHERLNAISQTVVMAGVASPRGVAVDAAGNVYIADTGNGRVVKLGADGSYGAYGSGLSEVRSVATNGADIYVADTGNSQVKRIATDGRVTTIAGLLKLLRGIALDPSGNLYVADQFEGRVIEIDPANQTLTTLGSGFNKPVGVAVDSGYTVYVTDTADPAVKRIALNGTVSATGSGWRIPTGVTVDRPTGDVYVADNALGLWQVKPHGAMSAVGSGWVHPSGVTFDPRNQDVYVVDPGLAELVKVTLSGKVSVAADRLPRSVAVAIDERSGNAWVADPTDDQIERIAPDGSVWTYGQGSGIKAPYGIAVDKNANVYVTDAGNYLVWKLTF